MQEAHMLNTFKLSMFAELQEWYHYNTVFHHLETQLKIEMSMFVSRVQV